MSLEIVTVKDAQGAAIEKKVITGISIDVNTGVINIGNKPSIKRIDGEWVDQVNYGSLSLVASDFKDSETSTDLTDFNNAVEAFKTAMVALAAKKLGV